MQLDAASDGAVFEQLRAWREQPLGAFVAGQEAQILESLCDGLFGYHLVQLGEFADSHSYLAQCPVQTKSVLNIGAGALPLGMSASAESFRLPVATDSIDALVLPHTLDFSKDPHQLLREAERVLIPDGRLILSGFNPTSLFGLSRLLRRNRDTIPWSGRFVPYYQLQDWLSLTGFGIESTEVMMFRPPLVHRVWLNRFALLDRYGERFWPMLAGVYVVRAVKRVSRLTPVGPRWRRLRPSGASVAEPSTRGMSFE